MKINLQIQAVPTHIITGFLGAGKTTLLKTLLAQKPEGETWAVLMNEFGEIGIDQIWLQGQEGIAVKEVLGGCLCCTSQLPMQIALSRLLSTYRPHRLFIEPTGLGHPQQLIEQLSEPHWQNTLRLKKVITVIDGHRLHAQLWQQHEVFLQQLDIADIAVISHVSDMSQQDDLELDQLKKAYAYQQKDWKNINQECLKIVDIDQDREPIVIKKQFLLTQQANQKLKNSSYINQNDEEKIPRTLPYHYVSTQSPYTVAGWHLPKSWQFQADELTLYLQQLTDFERIKGRLYTDQGWIDINMIPQQHQIDFAASAGLDNRLEMITSSQPDWKQIETQLLKLLIIQDE